MKIALISWLLCAVVIGAIIKSSPPVATVNAGEIVQLARAEEQMAKREVH